MWDLPGPGLEPVSPALTGGFLTTAPPGKPQMLVCDWVSPKADPKRGFGSASFGSYSISKGVGK